MTEAEALSPVETTRVVEFARACKAAARVVTLYPGGHPAIATTLGRIVQLTSAEQLAAPLRMTVLADALLVDGRPPARPDPSIQELATLLHAHLIGELTVHAGGSIDAWRTFLLLIGRPPDEVRREGGISRVWTTTAAGRHVEIQEIDYARVLREGGGGSHAEWDRVIAACLQGQALVLSDDVVRGLLDAASSSEALRELVERLDAQATDEGASSGVRSAALVRVLQALIDAVRTHHPEQLTPVLSQVADAVGQLTPEAVIALVAAASGAPIQGTDAAAGTEAPPPGADVLDALRHHMSDGAAAGFVARHALSRDTSIERVAQAFQSLVRDDSQRERVLALAHDAAKDSPFGATEQFEETWGEVAQKIMTSYSDKPFVSDVYARELTRARTQAVQVEQLHDDPPDRMAAWLASVATHELRALDLTLVLDLLRIEDQTDRWAMMMRPAVDLLNDLFQVGDFDPAEHLLGILTGATRPPASPERRQAALIAIDVLAAGPMMQHVGMHLISMDDARFERVKAMCTAIGEVLIRPLTEVLSSETRTRPRERLTAILRTFGPAARREVERLRHSTSPAVRRTAIHLMREFGGREALPQLTALLADRESQVQREAVRAILRIGTADAHEILERAVTTGEPATRDAMFSSIATARDDGAAAFFAYLVERIDQRGPLYLRCVEALGGLKDAAGIEALKGALYRGEWWAPRRSAKARSAAAAGLARIGTPEATAVLEEAARSAPRGARDAARRAMHGSRP